MSGRAKFVHWLVSPFEDIPSEPLFNVVENDKGLPNGSTIGGGTLMTQYGINLPLFPDLKTWQRETDAKRKCFRCWASVRGATDLQRHREKQHGEVFRSAPSISRAWQYMPLIFVAVLTMTGCNGVRHLLGVDRHDAQQVDVPVAITIIRQLPAAPGSISFYPDNMNANDKMRIYVKTGDWLTASPGAWYEIPWAVDTDTRTTEYAVVNFMAQSAIVYNQPATSPRAIEVHSIPAGAFDPGRPGQ